MTIRSSTTIKSNVTPYWWLHAWQANDDVKSHSNIARAFAHAAAFALELRERVENVTINGAGIAIELAVGVDEDASVIRDQADQLRAMLDDLVPPQHCGVQ